MGVAKDWRRILYDIQHKNESFTLIFFYLIVAQKTRHTTLEKFSFRHCLQRNSLAYFTLWQSINIMPPSQEVTRHKHMDSAQTTCLAYIIHSPEARTKSTDSLIKFDCAKWKH